MSNKTVYLGMIGDLIHPGITNIVREGAKHGDLLVGLFTDKAIATYKRLPYLTYAQREDVVANLKGVSRVVPQDEWSYVHNLRKYAADPNLPALAAGTPVHFLCYEFKGRDLVRLEEVEV